MPDRGDGRGMGEDGRREMIQRIRSRYMLVYHAPEAPKGSFRHIEVALSGDARRRFPSVELRFRNGYYAE